MSVGVYENIECICLTSKAFLTYKWTLTRALKTQDRTNTILLTGSGKRISFGGKSCYLVRISRSVSITVITEEVVFLYKVVKMFELLTIFVAAVLVSPSSGYTFFAPLITLTGDLGGLQPACDIPGLNITIRVGDFVKSYDTCATYNCTENGMSGAGFGSRAGVFSVEGCVVKEKACQPEFVQDPSSSQRCLFAIKVTPPTGWETRIPQVQQTPSTMAARQQAADDRCIDPYLSPDEWRKHCVNGAGRLNILFTLLLCIFMLLMCAY